jgi:hypothetical protein
VYRTYSAEVRYASHFGIISDVALLPRMGWTGRAPAPNGFR